MPSALGGRLGRVRVDSGGQQLTTNQGVAIGRRDRYCHCKSILALAASEAILERCGISGALPSGEPDPGLIVGSSGKAAAAGTVIPSVTAIHR